MDTKGREATIGSGVETCEETKKVIIRIVVSTLDFTGEFGKGESELLPLL